MFRPCIDLRNGKVVQIVGGTLDDAGTSTLTRFQSEHPPSWYAELYRKDGLTGGHVIALGPGNEAAAREALGAWPGGLQYGGGVNLDNASTWLEAGASQVIVTSWVFRDGLLDRQRLADLVQRVGKDRLVLDLSCRKRDGRYWVVTDRWQRFTSLEVDEAVCVLGCHLASEGDEASVDRVMELLRSGNGLFKSIESLSRRWLETVSGTHLERRAALVLLLTTLETALEDGEEEFGEGP